MRKSNKGYSLIELVVTVLISSMIMASAVLFLSLGLNKYKSIDAEEILQTESQAAEFYLTEIFQEAEDFEKATVIPEGYGINAAVQVRIQTNKKKNGEYEDKHILIVWKDDNMLYVFPFSTNEASPGCDANNSIDLWKEYFVKETHFLAQYVTKFDITTDCYEDAVDPYSNPLPGMVQLQLGFEVMGRKYSSSPLITLRNKQIN